MLQEGFGLSSSTVLRGRGTGHDMVLPVVGGCGQGLCLNRQNGMGPATDSLDHRAGACYLPCGLLYNKICCAVGVLHSRFPPPHFERALHLFNQGLHHSKAKIDVFYSLINSCAGPETQRLNVVDS